MSEATILDRIKHLYFNATQSTIQRDVAKAIDLFKQLPSEDERQKAAVYMDGLSQMRSEWAGQGQSKGRGPRAKERRTKR